MLTFGYYLPRSSGFTYLYEFRYLDPLTGKWRNTRTRPASKLYAGGKPPSRSANKANTAGSRHNAEICCRHRSGITN